VSISRVRATVLTLTTALLVAAGVATTLATPAVALRDQVVLRDCATYDWPGPLWLTVEVCEASYSPGIVRAYARLHNHTNQPVRWQADVVYQFGLVAPAPDAVYEQTGLLTTDQTTVVTGEPVVFTAPVEANLSRARAELAVVIEYPDGSVFQDSATFLSA
jgi:Tfp pilus assembly protein PilW